MSPASSADLAVAGHAQHAAERVRPGRTIRLRRREGVHEARSARHPTSQCWPAAQGRAAYCACSGWPGSSDASSVACGCIASTDPAPPVWSLSRWLSTTVSTRSPSARSRGTSTRWPASLSAPKRGPVSYSSVCVAVRTSTALPWPMSAASSSNWPGAGRGACHSSTGSSSGTPSARTGQGHPRIASSTPPSTPAAPAHRAAPRRTTPRRAAPPAAAARRPGPAPRAPRCPRPARTPRPPSTSGVTTSVTQGMAARLATRPTSDTWPNSSSVSGARASVTMPCSRSRAERARPPAPAPRPGAAGRVGGEQHAHRDEAQPEARLHQGPGIGAHHHRGGEQPGGRPGPAPARQPQPGHRGQHQQRALGRHAPAAEQRIGGGQQQAAEQRRVLGRPGQAQARAAPPGPAHQRPGQPGEHGDVQPGDRHQVGHAGGAEHVPVVAGDRVLVARHQRRDDAGGLRVGDARQDGVAHRLPGALDRVAPAGAEALRRRVVAAGAHVAGGLHALLPQPQLEVEAVRIDVAVRRPQPHGEAPAVAGAQIGQRPLRLDQAFVGEGGGRVPAERQPGRDAHRLAVLRRLIDGEAEGLPPIVALGHGRDRAGDDEVATFQRRIQRLRGEDRGAAAAQAERRGSGQCEGGNRPAPIAPPQARASSPARPAASQRRRTPQRPQLRLLQLQRRSEDGAGQHGGPGAGGRGVAVVHGLLNGCAPRRGRQRPPGFSGNGPTLIGSPPCHPAAVLILLAFLAALLVALLVVNFGSGERRVEQEIEHLYPVDDPQFHRSMAHAAGAGHRRGQPGAGAGQRRPDLPGHARGDPRRPRDRAVRDLHLLVGRDRHRVRRRPVGPRPGRPAGARAAGLGRQHQGRPRAGAAHARQRRRSAHVPPAALVQPGPHEQPHAPQAADRGWPHRLHRRRRHRAAVVRRRAGPAALARHAFPGGRPGGRADAERDAVQLEQDHRPRAARQRLLPGPARPPAACRRRCSPARPAAAASPCC